MVTSPEIDPDTSKRKIEGTRGPRNPLRFQSILRFLPQQFVPKRRLRDAMAFFGYTGTLASVAYGSGTIAKASSYYGIHVVGLGFVILIVFDAVFDFPSSRFPKLCRTSLSNTVKE
jgi:hypothetical protein